MAWVAHRGYHGLAMPTWSASSASSGAGWNNLWLGRDLVNLETVQNPRYVFEEFAARPRPAAPAAPVADAAPAASAEASEKPAAKKPAAKKPAVKKPAAKKPVAEKAPEPAEAAAK